MNDEGEVIGAYTYAVLPDGELVIEFMNRRKLDHIKDKAKSRSGPWTSDTEEMYRKTPTKRLFKYLPIPDRLEYAIAVDNWNESGSPRVEMPLLEAPPIDLQEKKATATEKLAEATRKRGRPPKESPVVTDSGTTTSPEAGEAPIDPEPMSNQGDNGNKLVDSDTVQEIVLYCERLGENSNDIPKRFGVNKLSELTNAEAGKVLGELLDRVSALDK
jgi:hypothetical protein